MAKFAGIKNNSIVIVSDFPFQDDELKVMPLPSELESVPSKDLISEYRLKDGKIISKTATKPAGQLKIAFVSNYGTKCGIGTYSKFLFKELFPHIADYRLFIEDNKNADMEDNPFLDADPEKIVACWKRGEPLSVLIKNIKEYDPDIVFIQHEFGLFSTARHWISMMNQLSDYRVIITMHSVFHHKDKTIVEAAMPEIVVHLDGAKKLLKEEKGIAAKVHVIPHGCFPCTNKEKFWNFYKSEQTIIQFGFGWQYKNWERSIRATAILKEKYPNVFFTGLFSESTFNKHEHDRYYHELMDLVSELKIEENIGIIRGYQSDQSLDSYLRTNKVALFPYGSAPEHEVWGASGAARLAMTKNIPIITSSANHFSDLPSIKADTPETMAKQIETLFSSPQEVQKQLTIQNKYLEENSWQNVARKYLTIFEN